MFSTFYKSQVNIPKLNENMEAYQDEEKL